MDSISLAIKPCLFVEGGGLVDVPDPAEIVIGRDPTCQIVVEHDERVSRRHARIKRQGLIITIEDLGSQNGTFVNEERVAGERVLRDHDRIRICSIQCTFALDPAQQAPPIIVEKLDAKLDELPAHFRGLLSVAEAVATLEDERAIARRVLEEVLPAVGAQRGVVLLRDPNGELIPLAAITADGADDPEPPVSRTILRSVLDERLAMLTRDALTDERLRKPGDSFPASSIQMQKLCSVCCVPLMFRDECLGAVQITSAERGLFGGDVLRLLTGVARVAALAFASARVQQERQRVISELTSTQDDLRSRVEQFRLLYQLEHQLATTQDLALFLSSVARQAVVALNAEAGSIFLVDEGTGRICFAYPSGGRENEVRHHSFEPGRGFVGHVVATGEPVLENDAGSSPLLDLALAREFGLVPRKLVAVPLVIPSGDAPRVIGALEVLDKKRGDFHGADLQLLTFLAAQVSSALVRMRLHEERERRERLATLGKMAGSIVHDLRSPLAVVSGYLELMEERNRPIAETDRKRMVRAVRRSVNRIGNMVREVLDFARDSIQLVRAPVTVKDFFGEIAEEIEMELRDTRIEVSVKLEYEGAMNVDPERLRRVVLNLMHNGVAAMGNDQGGTLTLGSRREGDEVVLEVADTGPGIPEEFRPRLFTPFATYRKKEGTGLGLSIAHSIVTAHGGSIRAEDAQPRGTRFVISLPG